MDNAKRRVSQLTTMMLAELASLRHKNGQSMTRVYGPANSQSRGGTVAFNVVDARGRMVPYQRVERCALERGVSIRGGCFCNPGAAERAFGFPAAETLRCMNRARTEGFTIESFAECVGSDIAVGAVRASLGIASNEADIARLLEVVESLSS
jgi:selenocysteine lyase/cysteine desulfurase